MNFTDLIYMTRQYCRDNNSYVFTDVQIKMFLNQAIDRIKQYKVFLGMKKLIHPEDVPNLLPEQYHYMLALFAASRCFDMDERFYEGVEKRNEFESLFENLIADIQAGNIEIVDTDEDGNEVVVEDGTTYIEYIKDEYFDYYEDVDEEIVKIDEVNKDDNAVS